MPGPFRSFQGWPTRCHPSESRCCKRQSHVAGGVGALVESGSNASLCHGRRTTWCSPRRDLAGVSAPSGGGAHVIQDADLATFRLAPHSPASMPTPVSSRRRPARRSPVPLARESPQVATANVRRGRTAVEIVRRRALGIDSLRMDPALFYNLLPGLVILDITGWLVSSGVGATMGAG